MKDSRIIFDENYYRLLAIFCSEKYSMLVKNINKRLSRYGLSLPVEGFKTVKDYHEWGDKLKENNFYPEQFVHEILEEFGIKPHDNLNTPGFIFKFYFHQKLISRPPIDANLIFSEDDSSFKVEAVIDKYTRDYDWIELWERIKIHKSRLRLTTKNKIRDSFEKYFHLYELFLWVEKNIDDLVKNNQEDQSRSAYDQITYLSEYEKLKNDLKFNDDSLRRIIPRYKKQLKGMNIL